MSKIIALDAGHGLYTAGKRCMKSLDPKQTREWVLNDRIMDMVENELVKNYDVMVIRVDDTTGKKDIPLKKRVNMANNANADVYLSMHHNAGVNGGIGGGTVVFYYSSKAKRMEQAQKFYNYVTDETKLYGNRSQRVIKKGFYVVKHTKMPAFLIENGFMDSKTDIPIILSEEHAVKTAKGVVAFLVEQFSLEPLKVSEIEPQKPTEGYYTVKKGDTLSKIGKLLGVNWVDIANLNNMKSPYVVIPGQIIKVPCSSADLYYPKYSGEKTTLYSALKSLGINASYSNRKLIAKANGISAYVGTHSQNTQLYNLLVAGLLKKE